MGTSYRKKRRKRWKIEKENKPKLRTYNIIKKQRGVEKYLEVRDVVGRCILGRLRSGTNFLRIDKGRERGESKEEGKCRTCWEGIEDEKHFLVECEGYESLRRRYKNKIRNIEKTAKNKNDDDDDDEEDKWLKIFLGQSNNKNILEQVI